MATAKPASPDPLIETPVQVTSDMDYPAHVRTYNRFINLLQTMIAHLVFLVMALYFYVIGHNPVVGTILLVIAVLVLLFGLFRNPAINRDFNQALDT